MVALLLVALLQIIFHCMRCVPNCNASHHVQAHVNHMQNMDHCMSSQMLFNTTHKLVPTGCAENHRQQDGEML